MCFVLFFYKNRNLHGKERIMSIRSSGIKCALESIKQNKLRLWCILKEENIKRSRVKLRILVSLAELTRYSVEILLNASSDAVCVLTQGA